MSSASEVKDESSADAVGASVQTFVLEGRIEDITAKLADKSLSEAQRFGLKKQIAMFRAALLREKRRIGTSSANLKP